MARRTLLKRLEKAETAAKELSPIQFSRFDEDALAIYSAVSYLDATMSPTYHDVEPTAAYARGKEIRNAIYGPIIPAHSNEHLKRYTRATGEFELAFGHEPAAGDILCFDHVAQMHSPENYSRHFGRLMQAWRRQLPPAHLPPEVRRGTAIQAFGP
jgi:hypothetical protein